MSASKASHKKRRKKASSVKLDPIFSRSLSAPVSAPNPLDMFPSKSDTLTKSFFYFDDKDNSRKIEEKSTRWLDPKSIDPDFGLKGQDRERSLRRAYRRLESSHLFNPVKQGEHSLAELNPSNNSKNFVLVEESRLQELTKLESKLRNEKKLLGEQCAWLMEDYQFHARLPLPATRLAMRSICEKQTKGIKKELKKLNSNWTEFCKQNHYDRPHLYTTESYLNSAPPGQRAMKLRMVKSAAETWRLRKDRDSMVYEDDLSYLTGKLVEADVRLRDYERYYILAARYGAYSEEDFSKDARPGKRYFIAATKGAIKLQWLWDRYWAMTKLRRYRAARTIQKYIRRHITYKNLHPIIRLRLKIGKKTYYFFCWNRWVEYNTICRKIKQAIEFKMADTTAKNFLALKKLCQQRKTERLRNLQLMLRRSGNTNLFNKFMRWKQFTKHLHNLKVKLRRFFGFPHFDLWVEYTKWSKHIKKLHRSAVAIQALGRMYLDRWKFCIKKEAQRKLRDFNIMVLCVRGVRARRQATILKEFDQWLPEEKIRRAARLNELERKRIAKRQLQVQEKEKAAMRSLKKHLKSAHGQLQINEIMREYTAVSEAYEESRKRSSKINTKQFHSLNQTQRQEYAKKMLLAQCAKVARLLEIHNFDTKQPPFLRCPEPTCCAVFTTDEQYLSHVAGACGDSSVGVSGAGGVSSGIGGGSGGGGASVGGVGGVGGIGSSRSAQLLVAGQDTSHQQLQLQQWSEKEGILKGEENKGEGEEEDIGFSRSSRGTGKRHRPFAEFHLLLRHYKGQDLLRNYLIQKHGISGVVNCLDAWLAVQEWRHVATNSENEAYTSKACSIYDLYVAPDAPRAVDLRFPGLEELRDICEAYKLRSHNGFYELVKAHPSRLRELIGWSGRDYYRWTTSAVLLPDLFNALEWHCFIACFEAIQKDTQFPTSVEYATYLQAKQDDLQQRQVEFKKDYEHYRLSKIRLWTKSFKAKETAMSLKAMEAVEAFMSTEIARIYKEVEKEQVLARSIELSLAEQALYEEQVLASDDAVFWVGEQTADFIFEFYTRALVDCMLQLPECRKGLLQYSGLLKASGAKRLATMAASSFGDRGPGSSKNAAVAAMQQGDEWFPEFFEKAQRRESLLMPVSLDDAASRIQARVRGLLHRNYVRSIFFQTFAKYYDQEYQAYYYCNHTTGEMTWSPPLYMRHLFPKLVW